MLNESTLKQELKRYPSFIKDAIKNKNYDLAFTLSIEADTMEWVLEDLGE